MVEEGGVFAGGAGAADEAGGDFFFAAYFRGAV
jgi:hypothetical protein